MIQQLPLAVTASNMPQMYTLTFPEGLPHTLMHLKNGGFATSIIGADGKIVGMASLTPMVAEAAIIGIFTAMSVLTGQFFLCQINKELQKINQKLDEIISFLYGDKKAELNVHMKILILLWHMNNKELQQFLDFSKPKK